MNVIGLWEVVSGQILDMKNLKLTWKTKEEVLGSDVDEDFKRMFFSLFEFKENGTLSMMMRGPSVDSVPKDELEKAVEAGEAFVDGGYVYVAQSFEWKQEGDDILINSKEEGEVLGEKIDPWKKVIVEGNTLIVLEHYQICKIGEKPDSVRSETEKKETKETKVITPEMLAAVGTYKGLYTKMVGYEEKNEESFSLELKEDGTGTHHRNDLDINVPEWSIEDGKVNVSERFMGFTLSYTGTLTGTKLSLFAGDPENPMTYEYVYEKQ